MKLYILTILSLFLFCLLSRALPTNLNHLLADEEHQPSDCFFFNYDKQNPTWFNAVSKRNSECSSQMLR